MNNFVICLMGPTASGKSALALQLAKRLNGEIINVDSAIVYREMNIGNAKPTEQEQKEIPHHLINIRDPKESYSAADFRKDAIAAIKKIHAKKKIPLLVGGTMLYFKALQQGLSNMPSANTSIRKKISEQANKIGWQKLHDKLSEIDPNAAKRIHPNDSQRIQRALEVYELTKKPISELQKATNKDITHLKFINIAIAPKDRKKLQDKIEKRFKEMLNSGFIEEVKKLYNRGDLNKDLPSIRAVGYRQCWDYLAGNINFEQMQEKAIIATRQLAKRQLTWLKSWPDLHWFESDSPKLLEEVYAFLNFVSGARHPGVIG